MAAPIDKYVYAVVSNIPQSFRSLDLRNYFSTMVEGKVFNCFHFRHRPEKRILKESRPQNTAAESSSSSSQLSLDSEHRPISATTCCIIKLTDQHNLNLLMKLYHRKHWIDRLGDSLPSLCIVARIKTNEKSGDLGTGQNKMENTDFSLLSLDELHKLPEMNPPDIMPCGNVGTPTSVFLELIRNCKIPPKVISSLGLSFPKRRSNKRYGNVPFDYGSTVVEGGYDEEVVRTGSGREINNEAESYGSGGRNVNKASVSAESSGKERKQNKTRKSEFSQDQERDESDSEKSDDDSDGSCEEWERHESLHNDVTNQGRTQERLFEEEMEIVWDKGSSGLVFYTDAAYWDALKGDFDERTTDDWNVDMSVYYEAGAGTKDAKDLLQMRKEQRRRQGVEDEPSVFTKTGNFEIHTKGIGRRLMTNMGWKDGQGLGWSYAGISTALDNEGQSSQDKRGLGYHGEKLFRKPAYLKKRRKEDVVITTIYDDPGEIDPAEALHRSNEPHHLKHREREDHEDD